MRAVKFKQTTAFYAADNWNSFQTEKSRKFDFEVVESKLNRTLLHINSLSSNLGVMTIILKNAPQLAIALDDCFILPIQLKDKAFLISWKTLYTHTKQAFIAHLNKQPDERREKSLISMKDSLLIARNASAPNQAFSLPEMPALRFISDLSGTLQKARPSKEIQEQLKLGVHNQKRLKNQINLEEYRIAGSHLKGFGRTYWIRFRVSLIELLLSDLMMDRHSQGIMGPPKAKVFKIYSDLRDVCHIITLLIGLYKGNKKALEGLKGEMDTYYKSSFIQLYSKFAEYLLSRPNPTSEYVLRLLQDMILRSSDYFPIDLAKRVLYEGLSQQKERQVSLKCKSCSLRSLL